MRAYAEPDALPTKIRRMLRVQCDGEWERVTVDHDGSFMVHNNAAQARRFLSLDQPKADPPKTDLRDHLPGAGKVEPYPGETAKAVAKAVTERKQPPPPPRVKREPVQVLEPPTEPLPPRPEPVMGTGRTPAEVQAPPPVVQRTPPPAQREPIPNFDAQVRALKHLLETRVETTDSSGVKVVTVPEEAKLQRAELNRMIWSTVDGEADWESIDVDATAYQLQQRLQHGLPQWLPFQFHPEVLAMWGMDEGLMTDALRFPQRVEIRPETRSKKYPVLAFTRGDLQVILGMRRPHSPAVIAAYAGSRLQGGSTGRGAINAGGGSKAQGGLPGTTKASIKRLRQEGCLIEFDLGDDVAQVTYEGNDLGKISVGDYVQKPTVQSDYQRILRKVNAINQRVPARR